MTTYPLTQPQLGIYFECVQHPEITEYNQPFVAHLPKTIDPDRLERALKTVYNARPELRTRYILQDGEPRQYVGEKDTLEVKRLTMTEAEAEEFVKNSVTPFDIYNEVLCRFWIIETPQGVCHPGADTPHLCRRYVAGDGLCHTRLYAGLQR